MSPVEKVRLSLKELPHGTLAFYSDTMGEGRPPSHIKLRSASAVLARCSFDKSSLKQAAFKKSDLTKIKRIAMYLKGKPRMIRRLI